MYGGVGWAAMYRMGGLLGVWWGGWAAMYRMGGLLGIGLKGELLHIH